MASGSKSLITRKLFCQWPECTFGSFKPEVVSLHELECFNKPAPRTYAQMRETVDRRMHQAQHQIDVQPWVEDTRDINEVMAYIDGPVDELPEVEHAQAVPEQLEQVISVSSSDDEVESPVSFQVPGSRFSLLADDAVDQDMLYESLLGEATGVVNSSANRVTNSQDSSVTMPGLSANLPASSDRRSPVGLSARGVASRPSRLVYAQSSQAPVQPCTIASGRDYDMGFRPAGPGRGFVGFNWARGVAPERSFPVPTELLPTSQAQLQPRTVASGRDYSMGFRPAGPGRGFVGYNWTRGVAPETSHPPTFPVRTELLPTSQASMEPCIIAADSEPGILPQTHSKPQRFSGPPPVFPSRSSPGVVCSLPSALPAGLPLVLPAILSPSPTSMSRNTIGQPTTREPAQVLKIDAILQDDITGIKVLTGSCKLPVPRVGECSAGSIAGSDCSLSLLLTIPTEPEQLPHG